MTTRFSQWCRKKLKVRGHKFWRSACPPLLHSISLTLGALLMPGGAHKITVFSLDDVYTVLDVEYDHGWRLAVNCNICPCSLSSPGVVNNKLTTVACLTVLHLASVDVSGKFFYAIGPIMGKHWSSTKPEIHNIVIYRSLFTNITC